MAVITERVCKEPKNRTLIMVVIESLPFINTVNLTACSLRFANNYICALTETVKSLDTGLPPNLPVTQN